MQLKKGFIKNGDLVYWVFDGEGQNELTFGYVKIINGKAYYSGEVTDGMLGADSLVKLAELMKELGSVQ